MVELTEAPPREAGTAPTRTTRRLDAGALAAAGAVVFGVAYFVTLASLWLNRPGLYMDEVNFVDAALGGFPHQTYVRQSVDGFPVLIIPYIGVVKSALFVPIFSIWGVSVPTIRIPAIALSAATLVVAYFMGREVIGRWSAILVVLMGTCPTFIFMSKVDWGPIVVAMFVTVSLLLAFYRYLNTGRIAWLWTVFALSLIGIFDKQNFVWLVIAVGVGGAVVYRPRLWQLARGRPAATGVAVAAFLLALLVFLVTLVIPNLSLQGSSSLQDPLPHLAFTWALFERTLGYSEVINFFTGQNLVQQPAWMDFQWVFVLAALGVLALRRRRGALPDQAVWPAKAAVFFLVVFVVMIVEVAATRQAMYAHHVIELMPYPVLILLCSLVAVIRSGSSFRTLISMITVVGLSLMLVAQAASTTQYVSLMQNPSRLAHRFSPDVYRDAAFINANIRNVDEVVSAGWGPGAPLFSLACPADRQKYRDDLYSHLVELTPSMAPGVVRQLFGNQRILLVYNSNALETVVSPTIEADMGRLVIAYAQAFPSRRHPELVLKTGAYNVIYLGPQPFRAGHGTC